LVTSGALSPEQLSKGVTLVDGVMSLSKLFVREPSADRAAIELAIANGNEEVLTSVANDPVVTVELHTDHHHSSGVHEWLTDRASDDVASATDPLSFSAASAPVVDAPPELLHMPDSAHLVEPLSMAQPRRIEPIRIDPIQIKHTRVEPILAEPVHLATEPAALHAAAPAPLAEFAPPPHFAESTLLAPPPLPPLLGLEEMSGFEQQFHVGPTDPETPASTATPDDAAPADEAAPAGVAAPLDDLAPTGEVVATVPTKPTLPTLGTITSWHPGEPAAQPFAPEAGLSWMDLPKLATTSKSVAEIVAEQEHQADETEKAERAEQAAAEREHSLGEVSEAGQTADPGATIGFTELTFGAQSADPFSSLPRFADLLGDDSGFAMATVSNPADAPIDLHAHTPISHHSPTTAPYEPAFETETLWTPPPAELTANEIWHLVDEMGRPVMTPSDGHGDAEAARGHRFHLGRRPGRRTTKD
jgi:hypothetical protein